MSRLRMPIPADSSATPDPLDVTDAGRWPALGRSRLGGFRPGVSGSCRGPDGDCDPQPEPVTTGRGRGRRTPPVLAATVAAVLTACGGGESSRGSGEPAITPPTGGDTFTQLDAPADHGLAPLAQLALPSGGSEEHGNVVIDCPAGGPDCVLRVAADGAVEYASTGGVPSISPAGGDTFTQLDAPAGHGLAPLAQLALPSGRSEEHGNVVIDCPAGGPDCVLRVAADGAIEYASTGGLPSVSLPALPAPQPTLTAAEIAGVMHDLRRGGSAPALAWRGARYPPRDAVTCAAVIIGCEGGLGPIHDGSARDLDVSDFVFLERRNGVSLAARTGVAEGSGGRPYRALAGWMDHSFYLIETPRGGAPPGGAARGDRYYRAHSVGNVTGTDPVLSGGAAATWSGVMWGLVMTDPGLSDPDAFVHGDATVTVSGSGDKADLAVDVAFTDIRHEATGARLEDMRWDDLPLRSGAFGIDPVGDVHAETSRHPASVGISGRFYGPNHEEAGGLFGSTEVMPGSHAAGGVRTEVSGAFGARRDQPGP